MSVLTGLLLLFQPFNAIQWLTGLDSYVYLGNTPYQNETIGSKNSILTVLLTQRGIAINASIDQLIWPTTSCLSNDAHDSQQALMIGYKKLVIDRA